MAYNAGAIVTNFTAGIKDFKAGIKTAKDELSGMAKSVSKTGTKLKSTGSAMTKYITAPLAAIGAAAGKFGIEFENSMTQSLSIMGDVSNEMRTQMENTAREVALSTDKSAKEAADSYYYLASAGMDAAEAMEALPKVAQFATAGNFDMATATDLLTDAQSALGLAAEDTVEHMENMQRVSDVLTQAQNMANASTQQFSEALTNEAAASLKATNKSIEEGVAVLSVFADQGRKGSEAGNTLARTLTYLQDAQGKNTDTWEELNMSIYDSEGNMKNMADIVEMLEKRMAGLSSQEQTALLKRLGFNAETQKTINLLMGTSDQIRNYQTELENAGGATEEIANKQMKSMRKQLGLLKDGLIDAALSIYDMLEPAISTVLLPILQALVGGIQKVAAWFGNLPESVQAVIGVFGMLAAAIGPVLVVVGSIMTAIAPLIPTITAVGSAIMALGAGPLVAIVAAVAAVIAIFVVFGDEIKALVKLMADTFAKGMNGIVKTISGGWKNATKLTQQLLGSLTQKASSLLNTMVDNFKIGFSGFLTVSKNVWSSVVKTISNAFRSIINLVTNWNIQTVVSNYWQNILDFTTNIWGSVRDFIIEVWRSIANTLTTINLFETFKTGLNAVIDFVTAGFKGLVTTIQTAWNSIREIIINSSMWDKATAVFKSFIDNFLNFFKEIPENAFKVWNNLIENTHEAFSSLATNLKNGFKELVDWIPEKIQSIVDGVVNVWNSIKTYFENFSLYRIGINIISSLADGVKAAMQKVINSVKNVASGMGQAAKKVLGINSPSKVFASIGSDVGEGLEKGIRNSEQGVMDKISQIKTKLEANMQISAPQIQSVNTGSESIQNSNIDKSFKPVINITGENGISERERRERELQMLRNLGAQYGNK